MPDRGGAAAAGTEAESIRRAAGAAVGFAVVAVTWNANGFSAAERQWAAAGTILLGALLPDVLLVIRRTLPRPGAVPAMLLATLVTAALCVPETDQFPLAALLPGSVLVAELVRRRMLGIEWHLAAALPVAWAGVFGATGRQSALVGAMFAWWPVILVVLVALLLERRRTIDDATTTAVDTTDTAAPTVVVAAVAGAVAAMLVARTGGLADTGGPAVVAAVFAAAGSIAIVAVAWMVTSRVRRR